MSAEILHLLCLLCTLWAKPITVSEKKEEEKKEKKERKKEKSKIKKKEKMKKKVFSVIILVEALELVPSIHRNRCLSSVVTDFETLVHSPKYTPWQHNTGCRTVELIVKLSRCRSNSCVTVGDKTLYFK